MTTTDHPERSVPKVQFTDAEAGAKEFPDSSASARHYNYFKPAKRKQTHYEDVTVEVQPDPRHYLYQGWIYGFANGDVGYPLHWTKLKAWGVDKPEPQRGPGSGGGLGKDFQWPAHGWHEFRDPNEEWEMTIYRYGANVVRQVNQNIENARNAKAFEQWTPNWVTFVERNVGAWMHIEHILGLYVFAQCNRSGPTNMHNTAMAVNSAHKIRFAQDLALYNLTPSEEIPDFDGAAHIEAWNSAPEWQGARKVVEAITAVQDDWGESIFAANVVFEPLVGELFRSHLVQQCAAGNGDFVTPTIMGAGEYDYSQRDLRWTMACFGPLTRDREFADHNKAIMQGWLADWVPQCLEAARSMQPLWSQPDFKPPRFEDSLDRAKSRFAGIVSDLGLNVPEELKQ
jgi:propane monooxygenase small subunit